MRILAKASTAKPRVQSKDGATGEGYLCVSCFIGEDSIDELLSEGGGGRCPPHHAEASLPQAQRISHDVRDPVGAVPCRTHHSTEVARQIVADGGLDRVLELMKELLDDDFVQLTFL